MALKRSTNMRNRLLDTNSFKGLFDKGLLVLFSGSTPAGPNSTIGASDKALLEVTIDASAYNPTSSASSNTGLVFASSAMSGYITKDASANWQGVGKSSGNAAYFRFFSNVNSAAVNVHNAIASSGAISSTSVTASTVCFQGTCGISGDLQMVSTSISSGTTSTIDQFKLTLPE